MSRSAKSRHVLLRDLVVSARAAGRPCTFLGVGPVSETVVRAGFEASLKHDCPVMFVASRNQVESRSLGHGYLMGGTDQLAFVKLLQRAQEETGYGGPVYICRDHGGPWQRDVELNEKYPVEHAMDLAKESFQADIEAGFNYLHVDPTKCPHPFTQTDLCTWTVDLMRFCEETRRALARDAIDYEVGTEDIRGGLTSSRTFDAFLEQLVEALRREGLPMPTCIVGQTGTLTRMDRNAGRFDRTRTRELAAIAGRYGIGLKEHNGDYLDAESCRIHPDIGVTAVNVAPEFGLVETDACLALADLEMQLVREGRLRDAEASHLRDLLLDRTFTKSPWKKWVTDDVKRLPDDRVAADEALRLVIARVCGHYVYDDPDVRRARATLCQNVNRFGPAKNAEHFALERVREAIEFYIRHFRLTGANRLVLGAER